jgi:hypothetical protein
LPRRPLTAARIATLTAIAVAALAGTADARLAVYAPKAASARHASFHVTGVPGTVVRGASLRVGRTHRSLPLRRVRAGIRRGRVTVRLHASRRPRRVRLVLRLRTEPDAARKPTQPRGNGKPAPAPAPSLDPGPAPSPAPSSDPAPAPSPSPSPDPAPSPAPSPDPAPAPVPSDPVPSDPAADCPVSAFGPGSWPGACWRPFAASSPFNRPIPDGAPLTSNSAAIVRRMVSLYGGPAKMTAGDADSAYDYSHPLYFAKPGDPVFRIHCTESWGTCPIEGHQVRIPDRARPAGGGDGHLAVLDYSTGWEYDLWQVRSKPAGGGTLEASWGGRTRLDGDGLGTNATAAHFALSAGIIRPEELEAGRIDHALFMVVKCTAGKVYPAGGGGAQCADTTNAPAGGMRFQLDYSSAEIEAMSVPRWKKTILHALATYGAYIGDTGGGGFNFQFQSGSTYTSFGEPDALVTYAKSQPGVTLWNGKYVFDVASGVDWSRMRVLDPCVAQGTCS